MGIVGARSWLRGGAHSAAHASAATSRATASPTPLAAGGQGGGNASTAFRISPLPTPPPLAGEGAGRVRGNRSAHLTKGSRLVHDRIAQHADLRHLDLDHVAGLEPFGRIVMAASASGRAGPDQI